MAPYINKLMDSLSDKALKKFIICLVSVFSIYPTIMDMLTSYNNVTINGVSTVSQAGSQYGYSIINFLMMYTIGAYLRRIDFNLKFIKTKCFSGLICCWALITWWALYSKNNGLNAKIVYSYCNPIIIITAVLTFVLFLHIKIKPNRIINSVSKATFTTYLTHSFLITWLLDVKTYVVGHPIKMLAHIGFACVAFVAIAFVVNFIYDLITVPIYKFIDKRIKPIELSVEE